MKPAIEETARASGTTAVNIAVVPTGLLLALVGTAREAEAIFTEYTEARRRAEEDAAIDAKDILAQAEEANALDPVG